MREVFHWDKDPKDFQLAAVQAQIEGVDMIVQAPTGSGKTALAAGPHVWPGNEGKFTIMVCPLLSLEEEMVHLILCAPSIASLWILMLHYAVTGDNVRY